MRVTWLKSTHNRSSPRQAHPSLHTLGWMRPPTSRQLINNSSTKQLFHQLPQLSALGTGGTAHPAGSPTAQPGPYCRYSLSILLPAFSGKVQYEELVLRMRGSRALGSMAVPCPVPVTVWLLWAAGREEEAAGSTKAEAALPNHRNLCLVGLHPAACGGGKRGGRNTTRQ